MNWTLQLAKWDFIVLYTVLNIILIDSPFAIVLMSDSFHKNNKIRCCQGGAILSTKTWRCQVPPLVEDYQNSWRDVSLGNRQLPTRPSTIITVSQGRRVSQNFPLTSRLLRFSSYPSDWNSLLHPPRLSPRRLPS